MTKKQLLGKWTARGAYAARHDGRMIPCYEEDIERGVVDADDLLLNGRQQWETTDRFQIRYGSIMYYDALDFFITLGNGGYPPTGEVIELKLNLIDAFWAGWEEAIGAHDLIEDALANRAKVLAGKMLSLLMVTERGGDPVVRFTNEAISQGSGEYQLLVRWSSDNGRHSFDFLFDQAYYMLDFVAANGLEDIEDDLPDADVYTRDLLNWLASTIRNLNYITAALEVADYTDSHALLQHAQCRAIGDIWLSLARVLEKALE